LGEIALWSIGGKSTEPVRVLSHGRFAGLEFSRSGRWLASADASSGRGNLRLFDLAAPRGASGLELRRSDEEFVLDFLFHPAGDWFVSGDTKGLGFWPLVHPYPWILGHDGGPVLNLAFSPDSSWLVTVTLDSVEGEGSGRVRAWPLEGQNNGEPRVLLEDHAGAFIAAGLDIDPSGEMVAVSNADGEVYVVPLWGGAPRELRGFADNTVLGPVAFSPDGRHLAAVPCFGAPSEMVIRIWDLDSGDGRVVGDVNMGNHAHLEFVDEDHLQWIGNGVDFDQETGGTEKTFDLEDGSVEVLSNDGSELSRELSSNGGFMVTTHLTGGTLDQPESEVRWKDLESGETRRISSHGASPNALAIDPTEQWLITGGYKDDVVRVGPVSGDQPHLLYGHEDGVTDIEVSPDGRWIASSSFDGTVRLWPMPDLSKPPLHILPHDELLSKLKSLTNLRVVRDEDSATGWKLTHGPFPGWETVPTW